MDTRQKAKLPLAFNPDIKRKIVREVDGSHRPCHMCGAVYPPPDAVHIIDEKEWKATKGRDSQVNGIPLCPNCHRVFDEYLRPKLFQALTLFGSLNLPNSWKRNNKISDPDNESLIESE